MAISNGAAVSSSGLRAIDLLTLVPLLEAMCEGLENAPKSVYDLHPHRAIAATFLNFSGAPGYLAWSNYENEFSDCSNAVHTCLQSQSQCSHHPSYKCPIDSAAIESPVWGPSLYCITSSDPKSISSLKSKLPASLSPPSQVFDALFPNPLSPAAASRTHAPDEEPLAVPCSSQKLAFTDAEMLHAQAELRSILSLGLSRLFIVLFQTAAEFDVRSFGENVNLAFGGSTYGATEQEGEFYGGCEGCVEDYSDGRYGSRGSDDPPPLFNTGPESLLSNSLYETWSSLSKPLSSAASTGIPAGTKSKSAKRARAEYGSKANTKKGLYSNTGHRSLYSPRPGAGLKAWDTVLHYEAVIREEEDEKSKVLSQRRIEREKNGLKANISLTRDRKMNNGGTDYNGFREVDASLLSEQSNRRGGKGREGNESDGRGGGLLGWNSCRESTTRTATINNKLT